MPKIVYEFLVAPGLADDDRDLTAINQLLSELNPRARAIELSHLDEVAYHSRLLVARDEERGGVIVGMACLAIVEMPMRRSGHIGDVVVDKSYRGQKIGEQLMEKLIAAARTNDLESIDLTSNSAREAANHLYLKLGFTKRDTNVFRLEL